MGGPHGCCRSPVTVSPSTGRQLLTSETAKIPVLPIRIICCVRARITLRTRSTENNLGFESSAIWSARLGYGSELRFATIPMAAPAIIAWAVKQRWLHLGNSPFGTIVSSSASRRISELAISELIADKLPFTFSRLNAGPLATRIASGMACGAALCGAVNKPMANGAILGGHPRSRDWFSNRSYQPGHASWSEALNGSKLLFRRSGPDE